MENLKKNGEEKMIRRKTKKKQIQLDTTAEEMYSTQKN